MNLQIARILQIQLVLSVTLSVHYYTDVTH